jgi:hypothetical protein
VTSKQRGVRRIEPIDLDSKAVALARKTGRDCVCGNLRRATRVVTKLYDDALRPSTLTRNLEITGA